ncbi:MAG TPA: ribonuclease HII [Candidatus Kapabacteria bacterium]|nr:ribonuclease HII [Candidatus Kapabacteria bacterium]
MFFADEELNCFSEHIIFSGTDEVGRGCLAGPVVSASVILKMGFDGNLINDSKQLTKINREEAYHYIINHCDYAANFIDNVLIDKINILEASIKSMNNSLLLLKTKPQLCFIDGNKFHSDVFIFKTIIKGDSKFLSIASASIIAKVLRDNWMIEEASKLYPEYDFDQHKGYATKLHFEKLKKYGETPIHRKTFLKKFYNQNKQLNIFSTVQ